METAIRRGERQFRGIVDLHSRGRHDLSKIHAVNRTEAQVSWQCAAAACPGPRNRKACLRQWRTPGFPGFEPRIESADAPRERSDRCVPARSGASRRTSFSLLFCSAAEKAAENPRARFWVATSPVPAGERPYRPTRESAPPWANGAASVPRADGWAATRSADRQSIAAGNTSARWAARPAITGGPGKHGRCREPAERSADPLAPSCRAQASGQATASWLPILTNRKRRTPLPSPRGQPAR